MTLLSRGIHLKNQSKHSVRFNSQAPNFSKFNEEDIQEIILKIQEIEGIDMDMCSTIEDESDNFRRMVNPERKQLLNEDIGTTMKISYLKKVSQIMLLRL